MSFLLGGYRHHEQKFNKLGSSMWTSMLLLACLLLIILTLFANVDNLSRPLPCGRLDRHQIKDISLMCAILMVMSYVASLVFTLGTHADMMDDEGGDPGEARMAQIEAHLENTPTFRAQPNQTDAERAQA